MQRSSSPKPPAISAPDTTNGRSTALALVAVIGPPGAGKSTIAAALADETGAAVFRLREVIRAHPQVLAGLASSPDPLGWVGLEAVHRVLDATFVRGRFAARGSVVLLDNFPGTAEQLDLLAETASATAARVVLLELQATACTVDRRVAQRRVCLGCGPDPHAPAVAAVDDPDRCGCCRMVLARRGTDVPSLHSIRLARYAANRAQIAERAANCGIPHLSIDADANVSEVRRAASTALRQLTVSTEFSGSRW